MPAFRAVRHTPKKTPEFIANNDLFALGIGRFVLKSAGPIPRPHNGNTRPLSALSTHSPNSSASCCDADVAAFHAFTRAARSLP